MVKELTKRLKKMGVAPQDVAWEPIFWADVTDPRQFEYFDDADQAGNLDWKKLRKFVLSALGDASAYRKTRDGNNKIYDLLPKLQLPVTLMRAPSVARAAINLSGSPTYPGLIDLLPQGHEIYLPHMSHFIPMEDPDLVARTIAEAAAATDQIT